MISGSPNKASPRSPAKTVSRSPLKAVSSFAAKAVSRSHVKAVSKSPRKKVEDGALNSTTAETAEDFPVHNSIATSKLLKKNIKPKTDNVAAPKRSPKRSHSQMQGSAEAKKESPNKRRSAEMVAPPRDRQLTRTQKLRIAGDYDKYLSS